jgi:hypothetical protein
VRAPLFGGCKLTLRQVKLEAETGKLRQEVFAVQERNGLLQKSVDEYRRQLENQQDLAMVMRNDYEKRLKDERDGGHSHIHTLQERMLQTDLERAQAANEADGLRGSLTAAQSELTTLRQQAQNIQTSMIEWGNQVKDLTMGNNALQVENATLLEKGATIGARYDANDLVRSYCVILGKHRFPWRQSIQEKTLVNRILEESRSFHEKRLMDKQNELRRVSNQLTMVFK